MFYPLDQHYLRREYEDFLEEAVKAILGPQTTKRNPYHNKDEDFQDDWE